MPGSTAQQRGKQLPPGVKEIPVVGLLDQRVAYENRPPDWPWIMVPMGATRALALGPASTAGLFTRQVNSALPFTLKNLDDQSMLRGGYYAARISGNHLFITGYLGVSNAPLDVHQPGAQLRIWVTIKPRMTLPIVVHYVEHGPMLKTRTTPDDMRQIIEYANRILVPQTNIRLQLAVQSVLSHERIGKRLGPVIRYDPERSDPDNEWDLITKHKITIPAKNMEFAALNVFVVRELNRQGKTNDAGAVSSGCCLFEDRVAGKIRNVQRGGRILAHEVGHHLHHLAAERDARDLGDGDAQRQRRLEASFLAAEEHQHDDSKNVMSWSAGGDRLNRAQIEKFNPTSPYR